MFHAVKLHDFNCSALNSSLSNILKISLLNYNSLKRICFIRLLSLRINVMQNEHGTNENELNGYISLKF